MSGRDIVIKGNKYGLTVMLDADMDFESLKTEVAAKFAESSKFFGKTVMAISFKGRDLQDSEEKELINVIEENCSVRIACIADADGRTEEMMHSALEGTLRADQDKDPHSVEDIHDGLFYKGTLRSGQMLESETSIIVLGDVNPGASLVSRGNVIVLGTLGGLVQAGAAGNENAFVAALSMHPVQIRIGDVIARSPDRDEKAGRKKKADDVPKIAFAEDGNIYIEPITKEVLNDLKI